MYQENGAVPLKRLGSIRIMPLWHWSFANRHPWVEVVSVAVLCFFILIAYFTLFDSLSYYLQTNLDSKLYFRRLWRCFLQLPSRWLNKFSLRAYVLQKLYWGRNVCLFFTLRRLGFYSPESVSCTFFEYKVSIKQNMELWC